MSYDKSMNPCLLWFRSKLNRLGAAPLRLVLVGLLLLLTGCETVEKYSLTYRLWDNEDLSKFSEPAPNPNLALFETSNPANVLVQYDALGEKHIEVTRRSYYLWPNQARVAEGKKPRWVKPAVTEGMKPIPVMAYQDAPTNLPPERTAYAVTSQEGRAFSLYRPPEPKETYDLPVYPETYGTAIRLAFTPFAIAGDTVMVCGVGAVVGFLLWVQSGAPH
jgi:hypothetical protein